MGKEVKGSTMVREALKEVVGKQAYGDFIIYVNATKKGYSIKVQEAFALLSEESEKAVLNYIAEKYNKQVTTKRGRSGSHCLSFVTFYVED